MSEPTAERQPTRLRVLRWRAIDGDPRGVLLGAAFMNGAGIRLGFVVIRRVLAGLQPILLAAVIGPKGVATFAALLALQQLLYGAAITGQGWSIYARSSPPARWGPLALRNAVNGLPGLALGLAAVCVLPLTAPAFRQTWLIVAMAAIVFVMKVDELCHSVLDRFVSIKRAETLALAGTATSTAIVVVGSVASNHLVAVVMLAIGCQVAVQVALGVIMLASARLGTSSEGENVVVARIPSGHASDRRRRRATSLDQVTGNVMAQLQLLLLQRLLPASTFGVAYLISRPAGFAAGACANVTMRSTQQVDLQMDMSRGALRARLAVGATAGLGLAIVTLVAFPLGIAVVFAFTIDAVVRPWFLFTSVAASDATLGIARELAWLRASAGGGAIALALCLQSPWPVLAAGWILAGAHCAALVFRHRRNGLWATADRA
jgi:hypothetical protein